ncbi:MAG: hypothetical protein IKE31_08610 [Eubacterium sp.]|nr:hypothetical protein [Eubacterium sp.]MBR3361176.1 hypothetical protein [Lachnospiraceae bacterium]
MKESKETKRLELKDEFKLLSNVNFRKIYKKVLYVDCRDVLEKMFSDELEDNITGIVAYCYIDEQEGLSLRPLMLASLLENGIQVFTFPHQDDTIYILRLRTGSMNMSEIHRGNRHMYIYGLDQETHSFFDVKILNFPVEDNKAFIDDINNTYDADPALEELRTDKYAYLDQFRQISYPDDVSAILYKEGNELEQVWVRLMFTIENEFFGKLLNEPNQDFGCHQGTIIGLSLAKGKQKDLLVFNGRTATFSGKDNN